MGAHILLVEDEGELAELIVRALTEEGFQVSLAPDGREGWLLIRSRTWDLILLDWWVPHLDGLALLERLRASDRATPVLFLTARDAVSDRVRALDGGADDYLCKPFAFEELLAQAVDRLALLVHDVVVLEDVFAVAEVLALDAFLGVFNLLRNEARLDRNAFFHAEPLHDPRNTVGGENTHQVVFE